MRAVADGDGQRGDPSLVELGHVQVDPQRLEGPGHGLWALIGPPDELEVLVPTGSMAVLPESGWRLVHELDLPHGPRRTFAAPRSDGGWAVVTVSAGTGAPLVGADPGPVPVLPGRAVRRAGLQLSWPAPITIGRGEAPDLAVVLRNTAAARWTNHADDTAHVAAWVLDTAGEPVPGSSPWVLSTGRRLVSGLAPDEAIALPATVQVPLGQLPSGAYRIEAVLTSLDLRTTSATLTVR